MHEVRRGVGQEVAMTFHVTGAHCNKALLFPTQHVFPTAVIYMLPAARMNSQ